jgi:hypothetical protein
LKWLTSAAAYFGPIPSRSRVSDRREEKEEEEEGGGEG